MARMGSAQYGPPGLPHGVRSRCASTGGRAKNRQATLAVLRSLPRTGKGPIAAPFTAVPHAIAMAHRCTPHGPVVTSFEQQPPPPNFVLNAGSQEAPPRLHLHNASVKLPRMPCSRRTLAERSGDRGRPVHDGRLRMTSMTVPSCQTFSVLDSCLRSSMARYVHATLVAWTVVWPGASPAPPPAAGMFWFPPNADIVLIPPTAKGHG